jgi:hypothetical protein
VVGTSPGFTRRITTGLGVVSDSTMKKVSGLLRRRHRAERECPIKPSNSANAIESSTSSDALENTKVM